jgi:hypothetical protein
MIYEDTIVILFTPLLVQSNYVSYSWIFFSQLLRISPLASSSSELTFEAFECIEQLKGPAQEGHVHLEHNNMFKSSKSCLRTLHDVATFSL